MIKTAAIEDIVKAALFTAYLVGETPLSVLLVAKVESGKSTIVEKFNPNSGIKVLTDCTAFGIWRDLHEDIENGNIKHLIFPELLIPLSKGTDTRQSLIMLLSGLIEEGIAEVHTGFLKPITLSSPSAIGLIACVASEPFQDARKQWAQIGFISRMLPVSFRYSDKTVRAIKKSIRQTKYRRDKKIPLKFPTSKINVHLPEGIALDAQAMQEELMVSMKSTYTSYGFRMLRQIQKLLMGMALADNRTLVTRRDLDYLRTEFLPFMGFKALDEPKRDAEGKIIYEKDSRGNIIYKKEEGVI